MAVYYITVQASAGIYVRAATEKDAEGLAIGQFADWVMNGTEAVYTEVVNTTRMPDTTADKYIDVDAMEGTS
jgi:hypothetical protein